LLDRQAGKGAELDELCFARVLLFVAKTSSSAMINVWLRDDCLDEGQVLPMAVAQAFRLRLWRARSTGIRRMASAAAAKKCPRTNLADANFRSSSHTSGNSRSAASGSSFSIRHDMRATSAT